MITVYLKPTGRGVRSIVTAFGDVIAKFTASTPLKEISDDLAELGYNLVNRPAPRTPYQEA